MDAYIYRERIQSRINAEVKAASEHLAAGRADDYVAYQGIVGKITGLKYAQDIVDEIYQRALQGKGEEDEL